MAKWPNHSNWVSCKCGAAIIAGDDPNRFSRMIVFHAMEHHTKPIGAAGITAFHKFLNDTRSVR